MADRIPRLSSQRESEIAGQAEQLATMHCPVGRVDPETIASAHGLPFRYASFPEEFDGILLHEAGRFLIVCNDRRSPQGSARSRFTFAHELGHYFLSDHRAALASGACPAHFSLAEFAADYPVEQEADCFAANLLMPAKAFLARATVAGTAGFELARTLSDHFGVSLAAAAYRMLGLDLLPAPAAIFHWNQLGHLASRRMSDRTANLGWEYCGLTDSPPPGSATAGAVAGLKVGTNVARSHVMDWFTKLSGHMPAHQISLREEVISVGHYGWLTLVMPESGD